MINFVYLITVIVIVLISMTLHEAMHAFSSYWLGDDTAKIMGRLTLNPIKHIDPFLSLFLPLMLALAGMPIFGGAKPVPFNPRNVKWGEWGVALVALAGPLANLLIAFITYGILVLFGLSSQTFLYQILVILISVNLGFFVFNMLPIPPLDGSRLLYALAPEFVKRFMEAMEKYGAVVVFAIILIFGSAFSTFMSAAISAILHLFECIFRV